MKNQKIKLPNKEKQAKSFEEERIQAFRQFMAAHLREIYLKDRLYETRATRAVN